MKNSHAHPRAQALNSLLHEELRHPDVRRLAWITLSTSPLIPLPNNVQGTELGRLWSEAQCLDQKTRERLFSTDILTQWMDHLRHLDTYPEELETFNAAPPRRLGHYAEQLWQCFFDWHPEWTIKDKNVQVFSADNPKQTLGELDIVLQHQKTLECLHLELAVKFYLRQNSTTWLGPNATDQLLVKLKRLFEHQLRLSQTAEYLSASSASEMTTGLLFSGRFYLPLKGMSYLQGDIPTTPFWGNLAEFEALATDHQHIYLLDDKKCWLAPSLIESDDNQTRSKSTLPAISDLSLTQLERKLGTKSSSLMLAVPQETLLGTQIEPIGFLVPPDWPNVRM